MEASGQLHSPVPIRKKLDGPQSRPGRGGKENAFNVLAGNRTPLVQPEA
jgi:hypothetical protein